MKFSTRFGIICTDSLLELGKTGVKIDLMELGFLSNQKFQQQIKDIQKKSPCLLKTQLKLGC